MLMATVVPGTIRTTLRPPPRTRVRKATTGTPDTTDTPVTHGATLTLTLGVTDMDTGPTSRTTRPRTTTTMAWDFHMATPTLQVLTPLLLTTTVHTTLTTTLRLRRPTTRPRTTGTTDMPHTTPTDVHITTVPLTTLATGTTRTTRPSPLRLPTTPRATTTPPTTP